MKKEKDQLGNRMKSYESQTTQNKLIPLLPTNIAVEPYIITFRSAHGCGNGSSFSFGDFFLILYCYCLF